jgi:hypothetical protein
VDGEVGKKFLFVANQDPGAIFVEEHPKPLHGSVMKDESQILRDIQEVGGSEGIHGFPDK